jgi:uncharacterized protein YbjT (DUF2867 family)
MFLVIGGSGNVGREVARKLAGAGKPVRILTRDPARGPFQDGAEVVQGDLAKPETLATAMKGVTRLYSLMRPGTTEHLARTAADAGVSRIVLLTSLAAEIGDTPMAQGHRAAETAVRNTGIPWTFLRPTSFASNSLAWAPSIRAHSVVRAPFGSFCSAVIDPRDIAAVAAAALLEPGHSGNAYPLTGPEPLSARDQVEVIARALGRGIDFIELSEEEARADMLPRMPRPVVESLLAAQRTTRDDPPVYDTVERITGVAATPYRDWVAGHLTEFA